MAYEETDAAERQAVFDELAVEVQKHELGY
jgi:hypothetical protein